MKSKTYWRGYIDSQDGKTHYAMKEWEVVTAPRYETLVPLGKILKVEVEKYRSGFFLVLPNKWHQLLPLVKDGDYLRGWFASRGRIYEDKTGAPRLTISGFNVDKFHALVKKLYKIHLPNPGQPSKDSKMKRVIVTGQFAKQLLDILEGKKNV